MRNRPRGKILDTFFLRFLFCFRLDVYRRREGGRKDDSRFRYTAVEFMRYDSGADRSDSSDDMRGD